MHLNFIAIGIIAGLILTLLVGIFCYTAYDNEHWIAKNNHFWIDNDYYISLCRNN